MHTLITILACGPAQPPVSAPAPAPAEAPAPPEAIYFVLVDRFHNGDPSNDAAIDLADPQAFHGGDIRGVRDKLDHIQDLGFTSVWLSPVWRMRTDKLDEWGAFHGYWVHDLGEVEPRMGDEAELRALSDDLHARGMRLYLDVVWNHVSFDSPLREQHPDWFHPSLQIEDWDDPDQRIQREVHGLPDLAQENPQVYSYLRERSLGWIERIDPDGFRVDAVRHMPLDVQARLGAEARAASGRDFRLIGEIFDGDPVTLAHDWKAGGFDGAFDFPLRYAMIDVFCKQAPVGRLGAVLAMDPLYDDPNALVTMLDNHDVSRVASECGSASRTGAGIDFLLAARGVPSLTYGTEVGLQGASEPHNRADMRFEPHPLRERIRAGLQRRAEHPALREGTTWVHELTADRLVLHRASPSETAVITVTGGTTPSVDVQFAQASQPIRGQRQVQLRIEGLPADRPAVLTGTGPQLGNWNPDAGVPIDAGLATITVPTPGVLEAKVVLRGPSDEWQAGANRYVHVPTGSGPLETSLSW